MPKWVARALYKFRPQLEDRLKIEHHISSIHEAVPGGFLTNKEEQDIISQASEYNRVRKLVENYWQPRMKKILKCLLHS